MSDIVLKKIWHRDQNRIAAFFRWDDLDTRQHIKRLGGRYSKTKRCWYFDYNKTTYKRLQDCFDNIVIEKVDAEKGSLRKEEGKDDFGTLTCWSPAGHCPSRSRG